MPKTATQRSREYRERIKLDSALHAAQKEKERERWKVRAAKMIKTVRTPAEEKKRKEKERKRKANWRRNKKCNNIIPENPSSAYKNSSALGKALSKANKSLPKESPKKVTVLAKIVQNLTPRRKIDLISQCSVRKSNQERKRRADAIPEKTVSNILAFFKRDDVSRMLPGIKDSILIRNGEFKERKQKRVLEMSLNEAYSLYCASYPMQSIGITKFRMLRPKHVLLASQKHQEICYCIYHENIELILHGFQNKSCGVQVYEVKELCNLTLCEEGKRTELCIDRQCSNCCVDFTETHFSQFDFDDNISYYQWVNFEGSTKKLPITCSVSEAIEALKLQLVPFARHIFNIKAQQREL